MSDPQFAIGDLVRHRAGGELGVVRGLESRPPFTIVYKIGYGFGLVVSVHECELEPAEPPQREPAPSRPFRSGDRVAFILAGRLRDAEVLRVFAEVAVGGTLLDIPITDLRLVEPAPEDRR